jgi:hypothetical protein
MTTDASIITLDKAKGALAVGTPTGEAADVWLKVLAGAEGTNPPTLTPGSVGAELAFTSTETAKTITQSKNSGSAHSIAIANNVVLISGSTYTVASESGAVGTLEIAGSGSLKMGGDLLVDGKAHTPPQLVLAAAPTGEAALLKGTGSVVAGKTAIVGGTSGWEAIGASSATKITISEDSIAADADTGTLTAVTGDTQPSITVAAGGNLVIGDNTTINLGGTSASTVGKIVFKQSQTNPAKVTLTDETSIILFDGTITADTTALSAAGGLFVITTAEDGKLLCNAIDGTTGVAIHLGTSGDSGKLAKITGGNAASTLEAKASSSSGTADVELSAASDVS